MGMDPSLDQCAVAGATGHDRAARRKSPAVSRTPIRCARWPPICGWPEPSTARASHCMIAKTAVHGIAAPNDALPERTFPLDLGLNGKVAIVTGGSRGASASPAPRRWRPRKCGVFLAARGEDGLRRGFRRTRGQAPGSHRSPSTSLRRKPGRRSSRRRWTIPAGSTRSSPMPAAWSAARIHRSEPRCLAWHLSAQCRAFRGAAARRCPASCGERTRFGGLHRLDFGPQPDDLGRALCGRQGRLVHAARSLAWELGPQRIRVNALSPGSILFEGGGWARRKAEMPAVMEAFEAAGISMGAARYVRRNRGCRSLSDIPTLAGINAADVPVDGGQRRPSAW